MTNNLRPRSFLFSLPPEFEGELRSFILDTFGDAEVHLSKYGHYEGGHNCYLFAAKIGERDKMMAMVSYVRRRGVMDSLLTDYTEPPFLNDPVDLPNLLAS